MLSFLRGPVCGTDNCPSRLWRIIAGRRTCQYGHVMEGDIEVNNDDDDYAAGGIVTRRLNLTTNATGTFQSSLNASQQLASKYRVKDKRIYGYDANILFLKSFQYILKKQCGWLIRKQGFSDNFSQVVKLLWTKYLKKVNDNDKNIIDEGINSFSNPVSFRKNGRGKHLQSLNIHISTSLAFLYIASMHIGIPVYASDFITWIGISELPYYKSYSLLPKQWVEGLPNFYLGLLEGGAPPHEGQFYRVLIKLAYRIELNGFLDTHFYFEGLLLKLIMSFSLPPSVFLIAVEMIKSLDIADNFILPELRSANFLGYHVIPEVRTLSYFIVALRWILLSNIDDAFPDTYLMALLNDVKIESESEYTIENRISKLIYNKETNNVFTWDDKQSLEYLNWVEKKFLPNQKAVVDRENNIDKKIARRKLMELFPLTEKVQTKKPWSNLEKSNEITSDQIATNSENGNFENDVSNDINMEMNSKTHLQDNKVSFINELQEKFISLRNSLEFPPYQGTEQSAALPSRIQLINKLEDKIIEKLVTDFALSKVQLEASVKQVEKFCIKRLTKT
ncbi:hypothetical protein TPHA_0N00580 [Tetrapisispora phaffii CBS 4417]|uniref:Uncharacterized protein n=1 Tax=Tetrapisispora phaffii (strain ATCC 24235 / CBS 4417 / NBRC 1672 / NRRL Y-8282 / UCD 70-5) TaxID=1071381 RepID=G8C111_TETPH|nr:hypothetical protein TPHA_0N00580 [Tetrapisispora phaffii CBS 4417]CCE65839.1 hypothetical protein TPHA_0N00580 [Tetrapisispora phaffii CBS 4417]